MLFHFEYFVATVPLAGGPVGFTELVIRAVDSTETPVEEHKKRSTPDADNDNLEN